MQGGTTVTPTAGSWSWLEYTVTGSWTQADIDSVQARLVRNVVGGGNPGGRADEIRVASVYVELEYAVSVNLEQSSYRWFENDVGHTVATGSTPFTDASYSIGGTGPAGGLIFHIDGNTYYEADASNTGFAEWGCSGTEIDGAWGTAIGTGKQNSMDILAGCPTADIAARIIDEHSLNGYDDWFMPSVDELEQMYVNLHTQGLGGFIEEAYWSSSQTSPDNAWYIFFSSGNREDITAKSTETHIRAARSFDFSTLHEFSFNIPTTSSIGAFRFEYCVNNPLADGGSCTAPTGVDVTNFTIDSQSGASGFSKDAINTTANEMVVNRDPSQAFNAEDAVSFVFDNIEKTDDEPVFVRIHTYDSDDITTATVIDDEILYSAEVLVGSPLAAQDAPIQAPAEGTPFRLRASLSASQGSLGAEAGNYKLQYAELGPNAVCSLDFTNGEQYIDVPTLDVSTGENWELVTDSADWGARRNHNLEAFNEEMWMLGGDDGGTPIREVWRSEDGETWVQADTPEWAGRPGHNSAVYDEKMWLMGGTNRNDVWYTEDGNNWTEATTSAGWAARNQFATHVYDNKLWVMGGFDGSNARNDVWYTEDGNNWTEATASAGWAARDGLAATVFDGKMWIYGGYDNGLNRLNDVWYSEDGVNWTEATASAGWSERRLAEGATYDGKMWILGGGRNNPLNDVWYSEDGVNWTEATASAGWSERGEFASTVYQSKLWVVGGAPGISDAWYTEAPSPPIAFFDNSNIPDGTGISESPDDPNPGAGNAVLQSYVESNNFTNSNAIPDGDYGIWDFSLVDNSAPGEATYCFRIVDSSNATLTNYSVMPEISIVPPSFSQGGYRWYDQSVRFEPENWSIIDNAGVSIPNTGWTAGFSSDDTVLVLGHDSGEFVTFVDASDPNPANWVNVANTQLNLPGAARDTAFADNDNILVISHANGDGVTLVDSSDPNPASWSVITNGFTLPGIGYGVTFTSDEDTLVFAHQGGGNVTLVDSSDPNPANWTTITNGFTLPGVGWDPAFNSDDSVLAFAHEGGGGFNTLVDSSDPNPANWSVIANPNITLPDRAYAVDFKTDDSSLVFVHRAGDFITFVDASDPNPANWDTVTNPLALTDFGNAVSFNSNGDVLVAAHFFGEGITLIDSSDPNPANWTEVINADVFVSGVGYGAGFSNNGNSLVATHSGGSYVTLIDSGALVDLGDPLSDQSQPLEFDEPNQNACLRMLVDVDEKDAVASDFKLQYAPRIGETCSTDFSGYNYADLPVGGSGGDVTYFNNDGVATGEPISSDPNDPTSPRTIVNQVYVESNNFSIVNETLRGATAMWDFSIYDNSDKGGSYCFRVVRADGSLLANYSHIAELGTPPRTLQQMRHGRWFDTAEQIRPFFW